MSDLSDLELVAQAMAPTETQLSNSSKKSTGTGEGKDGKSAEASLANSSQTTISGAEEIPDLSQIPELADIDPTLLASLSIEDRQSLLPLLAAIQRADVGPGSQGDDQDVADLAEIFKQMDQAGEVADELEDKLDRLIAALGTQEEGLQEVVPAATADKVKGGDKAEDKKQKS